MPRNWRVVWNSFINLDIVVFVCLPKKTCGSSKLSIFPISRKDYCRSDKAFCIYELFLFNHLILQEISGCNNNISLHQISHDAFRAENNLT